MQYIGDHFKVDPQTLDMLLFQFSFYIANKHNIGKEIKCISFPVCIFKFICQND